MGLKGFLADTILPPHSHCLIKTFDGLSELSLISETLASETGDVKQDRASSHMLVSLR